MNPSHSERFPVHSGASPPDRPPLVRSPVFVLRALCGAVLFAIGTVGLLVFEQGLLGLRADVIAIEEWWPGWMVDSVEIAVWLTLLAAIVGTNAVLLVRRRYRGIALVNAAAAAAIVVGAVAGHVVLALAPSDAVEQALEDASADSLGNDLLASVVAVVTIAFGSIASRLRPWAIRWATPDQLDEMATRAGLRLDLRVADMAGTRFDDVSPHHVSVYRRAT